MTQARELFEDPETLRIAPSLLIEEITNILWKKLRRDELRLQDARTIMACVPKLIDEWEGGAELNAQALLMAHQVGHAAYDCFYLAAAARHGCMLVTDDRAFLRALRNSPWENLARPLTS